MRWNIVVIAVLAALGALGALKHDWIMHLWKHSVSRLNTATGSAGAAGSGSAQATGKPPTGANGMPPGASAALRGDAAPPIRKAPPGFLYVLRRISKTTKSGVMGVVPGARLALLERGPAKTTLTDGRTDFEIDNEDLTDDAEAAEMARNADEQLQAELAAWQQRNPFMVPPGQASPAPTPEIDPKAQADLSLAPAKAKVSGSSAASGLQGSSLDRPAYNQRLSLPYWYRYDPWGHRYYIDAYGRWVYY